MTLIIEFVEPSDADDLHMRRVQCTDQALQYRFLVRPGPAFEQDDGPLAVHDLRKLGARKPLLQRGNRCIGITIERLPPFKFR